MSEFERTIAGLEAQLARVRSLLRSADGLQLAGSATHTAKRSSRSSSASREQIRLCLACLLARGHLLIEDVPGVGKTTLAHALAHVLGLAWQRVQFTSDLLPADIIGVSVFDRESQQFHFRKGPIFTQLLLADEVNRASPRTQSALLEAMEERQVSADVTTYRLPEPFFVVATQNPHEQLGTFALARIAARPFPDARDARISRQLARARAAAQWRAARSAAADSARAQSGRRRRHSERGARHSRLRRAARLRAGAHRPHAIARRSQARTVAARRPGPDPRRAGLGLHLGAHRRAAGGCAGRVPGRRRASARASRLPFLIRWRIHRTSS